MPEAGPSATALAGTAEAILDGAIRLRAGLQARAAALLARQALERALHEFWAARAPAMQRCPVRTQIQCLAAYVEPSAMAAAASAWKCLSEACHHHPYALTPSAPELRSWIGLVRAFCASAVRQRALDFERHA